jgi:hypothetical protein
MSKKIEHGVDGLQTVQDMIIGIKAIKALSSVHFETYDKLQAIYRSLALPADDGLDNLDEAQKQVIFDTIDKALADIDIILKDFQYHSNNVINIIDNASFALVKEKLTNN